MTIPSGSTPLFGLDAVAIDTETTGLDPRNARIVELAAVRIVAGRIDEGRALRHLVRPGVPIPKAAAHIHKIDDAAVADAPTFEQAWQDYAPVLGNSLLIGHSIGFDLAVLDGECRRAGIAWDRPASLCTRLLAQVVNRSLADYSLDHLAAWLGVETVDRHSALGDATIAAHVFLKLVPMLRDLNIRTVAEATRASRMLRESIEQQSRAGWTDVTDAGFVPALDDASPRFDAYPYRHRVRDIMSAPARFVSPRAPLQSVLGEMAAETISSVFVTANTDAAIASETGIVTERDILRAIAKEGEGALALPAASVMSRPLETVSDDAYAYVAIGRMHRLGIRHLGVVDATGRIVGALSARDLLHLRAEGALLLGDNISQATDAAGLSRCLAELPTVASGLRAEGFAGRDVADIVSRQFGALTRRAAVIAEGVMRGNGKGAPPVPYALAVLGSAGRGESLLAADQDNALIFADGAPDGPEDRWFAAFGEHVARILHEAGLPYCTGGVMAKTPAWRGSASAWRRRVSGWIDRSHPADLLNVDIFYDLRSVHGDWPMADELWRYAFDAAKGRADFAKLLAETTGTAPSAFGWFGGFKTAQGRLDLKKVGLFGIVGTVRALAIRHHVVERSTVARLSGLNRLGVGTEADLNALDDAHALFMDLVLDQQLHDISIGIRPTNSVAIGRLPPRDRERLRDALRSIAHLDDMLRELLFSGRDTPA